MPSPLWPSERLPPATVAAVRGELGPLVERVLDAVREENPVYAAVLEGGEGVALRLGVEQAVGAFLTAIERGEHPGRDTAELWRRLGEAEFQAGRSLGALRAAFRTGIRAAWRGAADVGVRAGVSPEMVIAMAEAIFVYADELATDVVEGYVRVQSDEAGERERRRRRLATLLVDRDEHDPEALEHAAELARWPLPRQLAAVALPAGVKPARLHPDALPGGDAEGPFLLVPDPGAPGREAELRRALASAGAGAVAALGPAVAPRQAADSLRWARGAQTLAGGGVLGPATLLRAEEHLGALMVHGDAALGRLLVQARLAPALALPAAERERLLDTLTAWLAHQRHAPRVAEALHVHPQTVRYRLSRLRELFGEALEDPEARFELELALRARHHGLARGG